MVESSESIYDAIPYPNLCHNQTHPDRLATVGRLLGLRPAPPDSCRVLELACARGGNLAPLGLALPDSEFVGLDYSAVQIVEAQALAAGADLQNVRFLQRDILDEMDDLGQFDYIIAHGLYSWSPEAVRRRVLQLCRQQLTPQGIAFISFNALPGWAMLRTMREMTLYHTRNAASPAEMSIKGRQFIEQLTDILADDQYFGFYVRHYAQELQRRWSNGGVDPFFLHDELEVENNQFYFHEFMTHLEDAELQYLSEAELNKNMLQDFPPDVARRVAEMAAGDFVAQEQLMDIVRNRTLRQALVVHKEVEVNRRLTVDSGLLSELFVAARGELGPAGDQAPAGTMTFTGKSGARFATDHPVSIAALAHLLAVSPVSLAFAELLQIARQQVGPAARSADVAADAQVLGANLLRAYTYDDQMLMLSLTRPPLTRSPGERPLASSVARWQAENDYDVVANLRLERVRLEPVAAMLLPLLDGGRTQAELQAHLQALVDSGTLRLQESERPVNEMLAVEVAQTIDWLARAGLLIE